MIVELRNLRKTLLDEPGLGCKEESNHQERIAHKDIIAVLT